MFHSWDDLSPKFSAFSIWPSRHGWLAYRDGHFALEVTPTTTQIPLQGTHPCSNVTRTYNTRRHDDLFLDSQQVDIDTHADIAAISGVQVELCFGRNVHESLMYLFVGPFN